ncbi:MAG: magnesium-translocating P-type ATPase [Erysipelotrichaceae bacterium]|jgi:Mg2+-importing ATPase|nr:magnesium-translocating P-type ATPase [Erysipelotrichaceae bacterium]MCI1325844.1 magnesium-translocating P-type ATPase [Solobacterium sp.]MCH4044883.1 magnesium-translocating P-type ATPase [Erysipelotrichaceae bacterium]MCH4122095.1 magnesium-translocating P-type ATPase [Erysipelotrichaceae bacterium]MCI1362643.1 magnesium-translocating P-type ATPase [Solobacterium sp.]
MEKKITKAKVQSLEEEYQAYARRQASDVLQELKADENGISQDAREERLDTYGSNDLHASTKKHWWNFLLQSFTDAFIIVLLLLGTVTVIVEHDALSAGIIYLLACMSAGIRFVQDYRSYLDVEKLRNMEHDTVRVRIPDGSSWKETEMPVEELVPGDIEMIGSGDIVSGDLYLLASKDLFLSEAAFTGEAVPVEKKAGTDARNVNAAQLDNICLSGSTVASGTGFGVIIKTGRNSYLGHISATVDTGKQMTEFDRSLQKITKILITYMVVVVIFVLFVNGMIKHNWLEAFLFAISVAVGITPNMLPMIVNGTLAKGAQFLAKKKTIVKNMSAIQNFGAMDTLCTDKTGTLTADHIVLQRYLDINGKNSHLVLNYAWMNSYYSTGVKNLIDRAILEYGKSHDVPAFAGGYEKIDEIPYDFERRRMSVLVYNPGGSQVSHGDEGVLPHHGERVLITKGALESVLACCDKVRIDKQYIDIDDVDIEKIKQQAEELNKDGLHIIAVAARKSVPGVTDDDQFTAEDEHNMTFLGTVAFLDPPKPDAKDAIEGLYEAGVDVKVISGDAPVVVQHICHEVGLKKEGDVIDGTMLDGMDDAGLSKAVENTNIFARLSPMQKKRVVDMLRKNGHVVGYMGDGVNDAPSLHSADVGISVDNATDVAKASSDIILLEKSLDVILDGVKEGRRISGNIIKYIKMALSSNFGNVFSVLIASLFLPFLPMMPLQILIQNLVYDFTQIAIPWDNVDPEFLKQPHQWTMRSLTSFMNVMGGVSSCFDVLTFLCLWFVLGFNSISMQSYFQTGWFVEGLISQIMIVQFIRTARRPIIDSHCDVRLAFASILGIIAAILIPYMFCSLPNSVFVALPYQYYIYLVIILILYSATIEVVKKFYIRKFGSWL